MLVTIHFYRSLVNGQWVEVHKFHVDGTVKIARRVYHPQNHAWLECKSAKQLRTSTNAIARNVRIMPDWESNNE